MNKKRFYIYPVNTSIGVMYQISDNSAVIFAETGDETVARIICDAMNQKANEIQEGSWE